MKPFSKLRQLLEKSTIGPWREEHDGGVSCVRGGDDSLVRALGFPANSQFIAEAHNTLPKVLEALDVAIAMLKRSEGHMFSCCQPDKGDWFAEWDEEYQAALAKIKELAKEL